MIDFDKIKTHNKILLQISDDSRSPRKPDIRFINVHTRPILDIITEIEDVNTLASKLDSTTGFVRAMVSDKEYAYPIKRIKPSNTFIFKLHRVGSVKMHTNLLIDDLSYVTDLLKNSEFKPNIVLYNSHGKQKLYLFYCTNVLCGNKKEYDYVSKVIKEKINSTINDKRFTIIPQTNFITCGNLSDTDVVKYQNNDIYMKSQIQNFIYSSLIKSIDLEKIPRSTDDKKQLVIYTPKEKLTKSCELYRSFQEKINLTEEEKILLVSNLAYIRSSQSMFTDFIDRSNTPLIHDFVNSLDIVLDKQLEPSLCEDNCRFSGECASCKFHPNVLDLLKSNNRITQNTSHTKKDSSINFNDLDQSRGFIKETMVSNLSNNYNDITIYKVPAGLGKTHCVLENFANDVVIAFPNHRLKSEKVDEYYSMHNRYPNITEDVNNIVTDEADREMIQNLYNKGLYTKANEIIIKYENGEKFISKNKQLTNSHTFTTHEHAVHSSFNDSVKAVVFDEDPIDTIFRIKKISSSHLLKDIETIKSIKNITQREINFLEVIHKAMNGRSYIRMKNLIKKHKAADTIKSLKGKISKVLENNFKAFRINMNELLSAEGFHMNSYAVYRELPNKKIIILSATPDIDFYKSLDRNVKVVEISLPRKGTIKQLVINTSKMSLSKQAIQDLIKKHADGSKMKDIITFKSLKDQLNDYDINVYGGNVNGYNSLKGKDICIAYTFRKPTYYFTHKLSFIDKKSKIKHDDIKLGNRKLSHNGLDFKYFAFNNNTLNELMYNSINNELIQSAERARTLTEDCEVLLCSNMPCSIVDFKNIMYVDNYKMPEEESMDINEINETVENFEEDSNININESELEIVEETFEEQDDDMKRKSSSNKFVPQKKELASKPKSPIPKISKKRQQELTMIDILDFASKKMGMNISDMIFVDGSKINNDNEEYYGCGSPFQ